jgi:carbonic anhydrase
MTQQTTWIDDILAANSAFRERIVPDQLPTTRTPGPAVITCMDPRVNLEAIGIPGFAKDGSNSSPVRVIRTLGAMADNRSLIVGIFLAGFREIVVLMHTRLWLLFSLFKSGCHRSQYAATVVITSI